MDRATAGQVMYENNDFVTMNEKKLASLRHGDSGFIFKQMHLISNLSLYENIVVSGYLDKEKSAAKVQKTAKELIEKWDFPI